MRSKITIEESDLVAYQVTDKPAIIRKALYEREWMDQANDKFPYRCLPLNIANQIGWDILNPVAFKAVWNGGSRKEDIKLEFFGEPSNLVLTHFGIGTLTFTTGYLFKTPPGLNLLVTGPFNTPKIGIYPLTGIVETDWLPATFTMNWKFTEAYKPVVFQAGESICRILPIPRYVTEIVTPKIKLIQENQELKEQHEAWRASRDSFNKGLKVSNSDEVKRKWQRDYFLGGGSLWKEFPEHQTKLEQKEFEDTRPSGIASQDQKPQKTVKPVALQVGGRTVQIMIDDLESEKKDVSKSKGSDYITALIDASRGHNKSGKRSIKSNLKITGDGAHERRRVKKRTPGDSFKQDSNNPISISEIQKERDNLPSQDPSQS